MPIEELLALYYRPRTENEKPAPKRRSRNSATESTDTKSADPTPNDEAPAIVDESPSKSDASDGRESAEASTSETPLEAAAPADAKTEDSAQSSKEDPAGEKETIGKREENEDNVNEEEEEFEEDESELRKLYPETYKTNEPRLLRSECLRSGYHKND